MTSTDPKLGFWYVWRLMDATPIRDFGQYTFHITRQTDDGPTRFDKVVHVKGRAIQARLTFLAELLLRLRYTLRPAPGGLSDAYIVADNKWAARVYEVEHE